MYFMNELFDNNEEDNEEEEEHDHPNRISKGERMKETNHSFLGKIIQCGTGTLEHHCGNNSLNDEDDEDSSSGKAIIKKE